MVFGVKWIVSRWLQAVEDTRIWDYLCRKIEAYGKISSTKS
jgi:hypothetical protein